MPKAGGVVKKLLTLLVWFLTATVCHFLNAQPNVSLKVPPAEYKPVAKELAVTFIDVGQGDSIFIKTPNGKSVLVDSGGTPQWSGSDYDPGKEKVLPYLESRKIKRLDYVIMSHGHGDHIAGLPAVLEKIPADIIYENGFDSEDPDYEIVCEFIGRKKIPVAVVKRGDVINIDPSVRFEVLSPPADYYFEDDNNNAIAIRIIYGDVSFLLAGDIEAEAEGEIEHSFGSKIRSNILKVAHHGSTTSTTESFLNKVSPEVAVICVGKYNNFGHPDTGLLAELDDSGIAVYRTDKNGNITIKTDGKKFKVEPENDY